MRPLDQQHDEEPLDLGLFEMMMGVTPEEWDATDTEQDDGEMSPLHDK